MPNELSKRWPPGVALWGKDESNLFFHYSKLRPKKPDKHTLTRIHLPWNPGTLEHFLLTKALARVRLRGKNIAQPQATSVWPPNHSEFTSDNFAYQQAPDLSDRAAETGKDCLPLLTYPRDRHYYRTPRRTFPDLTHHWPDSEKSHSVRLKEACILT